MKPMPIAVAYDPYDGFVGKRIFSVLALTSIFLSCCAWSLRSTIADHGTRNTDLNLRSSSLVSLETLGQVPLFDPSDPDPWKRDLYQRLDRIRESCGPLCTISDEASLEHYTASQGPYFRILEVPVDCNAIMVEEAIDELDHSVPFPVPEELLPYYSMSGMIRVVMEEKLAEASVQQQKHVWSKELIEEFQQKAEQPNETIHSPHHWTYRFRNVIEDRIPIAGKRVLVMGTELPWIEGLVLKLGAEHVTTLVPMVIQSQHPQVTTMTPEQLRVAYRKGQLSPFDVVLSFSSLEHFGLGRYGDSLNPWGDVLATARARCMTKKGGFMALAVPTGKDDIQFNKDRKYGEIRYPLLGANWIQVDGNKGLLSHEDQLMSFHPTFVFQNP